MLVPFETTVAVVTLNVFLMTNISLQNIYLVIENIFSYIFIKDKGI